jgi:hypothetical protein
MPRQQFESVIAQAARKQLKIARLDVGAASIQNGQSLAIDLYANANKIAYVKSIFFRWIMTSTTATSGEYDIMFEVDDIGAGISPNFLSKSYAYSVTTAMFDRFTWFAPTTGATPAGTTDAILALQNITFDSTRAFRCTVVNRTNAWINGTVECYVLYEEEEVRL